MKRLPKRLSAPVLGVVILATALPFAGCEVFELEMRPFADTTELFSLARPEFLGRPSAFDFWNAAPRVIETAKFRDSDVANFDLAFSELDGEFVVLPAGVFQTISTTPGVQAARPGVPFVDVVEAPDTGYVTSVPVPIDTGVVYIVRTRTVGGTCTRYAKFEVLELDPAGVIEFEYFRNDRCNDRLITYED